MESLQPHFADYNISLTHITLYFPTQSITSSLDCLSSPSLIVPNLTHPHQHGRTVSKHDVALLSKAPSSLAFLCSVMLDLQSKEYSLKIETLNDAEA